MNKFALESFNQCKSKPFIICYEDFSTNKAKYIKEICCNIGIPYKDQYAMLGKEKIGNFTKENILHEKRNKINEEYLENYFSLLHQFSIYFSFDKNDILNKYQITDQYDDSVSENQAYGLHSRALIRYYTDIINEKDKIIKELENKIKTRK